MAGVLRSALRGPGGGALRTAQQAIFRPTTSSSNPAASFYAAGAASTYATDAGPAFHYQDLWETDGPKEIPWRKITGDHVSVHEVMVGLFTPGVCQIGYMLAVVN
jgi:hypothetical protein